MKRCSKCREEKPREAFTTRRQSKDGLAPCCKACTNAYQREHYARNLKRNRKLKREAGRRWHRNNPEASNAKARRWEQKNPERVREAREQWRQANPDYFREWYWKNVEKERARLRESMRRWRLLHPEEEQERHRRYRKANPEIVRQRERENTQRRRAQMKDSSEDLARLMAQLVTEPCTYCGSTESITVDHIVPLSRGGKHEATNLAPACVHCNCSKGAKLLDEWLDSPLAA